MDFDELDGEKKTKLVHLLNRDKLSVINETFDSEIYQQALHLIFSSTLGGDLEINNSKVFTGYSVIEVNNFIKKENEFVNLFGTLITPNTANGLERTNNFEDEYFTDIYDLYYDELTNTSVKRGLKVLYEIVNPPAEPSTHQSSTEGLDILRQFTEKYDIDSPQSRIKIYNYWFDIYHNKFLSYEEELNLLIPSGIGGDVTGMTEQKSELLDKLKKIKDNFEGLKFPCYTVNLKAYGKKKQEVDEIAALKIANGFLSGNVLEEDMKTYKETFPANEAGQRGAQEFVDNSKAPIGDMPDIKSPIQSIKKKIKMVTHDIDPLTALSIYSKGDLLMSPSAIEKTIELIHKEIKDLDLKQLKELILEDLDEFINEIKDDIVDKKDNEFNFSILDDMEHVNIMNNIYSGKSFFMYEYYEFTITESVKEEEFGVLSAKLVGKYVNTYSDLVKMINEDTNQLLKVMAEQINLQTEVSYLYNDIISTVHDSNNPGDSTPYLQGGDLPAIPGKEPSLDYDGIFSELLLIIKDYYFNSMDPAYLFNKDAPAFTSSSEYQSMKSVFGKSFGNPISRIKQDLRRYGEINVTKTDLVDLTRFFILIRKYSTLGITTKVLIDFNDAYLALINIHMTSTGSTTRRNMQRISTTYRDMLGKILFEIAEFKNTNKDEMDEIQFRSRPLSSYANIPTKNIDNIHEILDDKDFVAYAKRKKFKHELARLKTEIKTNSTLKLIANNDELKADITSAYVNALDTLKKMKGETIYKAYLHLDDIDDIDYATNIIRKENNVDIFVTDIEGIVESTQSFNTLSKSFGISQDIIYKIKGLFR